MGVRARPPCVAYPFCPRLLPMALDTVTLAELLRPDTIRVGLPGSTKAEVLDALIALLVHAPEVDDLAQVRADVLAREDQMSTGVGKGLALPHARSAAVSETVAAFAVTADPIPFGSIDDRPVRLLFLLVGPEDARSRHIRLLSRISQLMNSEEFRQHLLEADSPEAVLDLFRAAEAALDA